MNQKERLLKALSGEKIDRPPVICPGGMMNAGVTGILDNIDENHNCSVDAMVEVAKRINEEVGFENYGVPFCMTIEAEPVGVRLDFGGKLVEPLVKEYNEDSVDEIMKNYRVDPLKDYRMPVVIEAIKKLKNDEVPVIGNITGPLSTATSIVDPLDFLKMLRRDPDKAFEFLKYVNEYSIRYALEMVRAGADVITFSDPTATGEILGSKNFERFVVPLYTESIEKIHAEGAKVIVHICGKAKAIVDSMNKMGADALSFDSAVGMKMARRLVHTRLMGNVSTQLLNDGVPEKVVTATTVSIESGVDIVAPACGLGMSTPVENLKAMTGHVKDGNYSYVRGDVLEYGKDNI